MVLKWEGDLEKTMSKRLIINRKRAKLKIGKTREKQS